MLYINGPPDVLFVNSQHKQGKLSVQTPMRGRHNKLKHHLSCSTGG